MKTRGILSSIALVSVLVIVSAAVAAPVPARYRSVRVFLDPDGPDGLPSSHNPYDTCARYNKALKYAATGFLGVQLGPDGYSFPLDSLAADAARIWNSKLQSNACSFSIAAANLTSANFVINSDHSEKGISAIAVAIPKGYETLTGLAPGLYVNKANPITYSLEAARALRLKFDASMSSEEVARALALLTIVHEFGHALGLTHPVEEVGNPRDNVEPEYSPHSVEWLPGGVFASGPIMIGSPDNLLDVMYATPTEHRLKLSDIQPSDIEANTIKQLLSCSAAHTAQDARLDATCSSFLAQGRRVLQYPYLVRPIFQLLE